MIQYTPSVDEVLSQILDDYKKTGREPSLRNSAIAAHDLYTPLLAEVYKASDWYETKIRTLEDQLENFESELQTFDHEDEAADVNLGVALREIVKAVRIHPVYDEHGGTAWEIIIDGHKRSVLNPFNRLGDAVKFARIALGAKDRDIVLYNRVRKVVCTGLNL